MAWRSLPDGAFVIIADRPALVRGDSVMPWTTEGYAAAKPRPRGGDVDVLTPPSTVAALRGGYVPQIDDSATSAVSSRSARGGLAWRQPSGPWR